MINAAQSSLKVLFIGDIVGQAGVGVINNHLAEISAQYKPDIIIANGENASPDAIGLTVQNYQTLRSLGVDLVTSGNHIWGKEEINPVLERCRGLIRPGNYQEIKPGQGYQIIETAQGNVVVVNLLGSVFTSDDKLINPFDQAEAIIEIVSPQAKIIIFDFHAEASSEKLTLGRFLDGRVSAVLGTHTHVQTADAHILPGGTAYITDVGMTAAAESIIGVEIERYIEFFTTKPGDSKNLLIAARSPFQLNAVLLTLDPTSGKALAILPIQELYWQ